MIWRARSWQRNSLLMLCGALAFAAIAVVGIGQSLIRPANRLVGAPPAQLHVQSILLRSTAGETVSAWFAHGIAGQGVVLLLHGVRADRRAMVSRAKLLQDAGFGVMLMDLQAHGESGGAHISFGWHEADGVRAALNYLQQNLPHERIGVIGVSLGAASLVLAKPVPAPSAVVLESMYPTITEAVENRLAMRLGCLGNMIAPALLWQLPLRLGISADQLRPIDAVASLGAPVLIAGGTLDLHTPRVTKRCACSMPPASPKSFGCWRALPTWTCKPTTPKAMQPRYCLF